MFCDITSENEVNVLKELYYNAEMEVINFSVEDVISTSIETDPTIIWPTVDDNTTDVLAPIP